MHFIDSHCHFDFPPFAGDEDRSLARARAAGLQAIIVPATEADHFARILALTERDPLLWGALGLHPIMLARHNEAALAQLEACLAPRPARIVAIGEVGLDLFIDDPQLARQQALLQAQLRLAQRYDLPVILHSRRSHDQLAACLRRTDVPRRGVIHGFAGSLQQAQTFLQLGYLIGVGGTISWPRAQKTRRVIAQLPLSALVLETDAPDMPLCGWQGQPNRPERVVQVFQALCALRREPPADIAATLEENARRLFGLPR